MPFLSSHNLLPFCRHHLVVYCFTLAFVASTFGPTIKRAAVTAAAVSRAVSSYSHNSSNKPFVPLFAQSLSSSLQRNSAALSMGKKKTNGAYNDFIDGEKLRDNAEVRTSLQSTTAAAQPVSSLRITENSASRGRRGLKKPPLTHFLCLPLVTESSRQSLQQGLKSLKQELEKDGIIPPKAIRPVGTLHLTLGVMSLDKDSLQEACLFLRELDIYRLLRDISHQRFAEKAAEEGEISENLIAANMPSTDALSVNLQSLIPMQAAQKTSILYAEPKDFTARLFPFAKELKDQFEKEGFLVADTRPLKLHATIVNTVYAKSEGRGKHKNSGKSSHKPMENSLQERNDNMSVTKSDDDDAALKKQERAEGHGPDAKSWLRFDASKLIEEYKGFAWARDIQVDRVQICRMGAKRIWSSGIEGEGEILDERYEVVCEKAIFE